MAQRVGTSSTQNSLIVSYDASSTKCFKGGAATNLLNSETNSYPKVGNSWGTYNTNQYNNNTFFSIGTVSSVTDNIVTTNVAHPLRTYDVVQPQTTGGGVTAGTNYFVKKWTNTTFSLHSYDSNEDGTKGWATRASINNDVRVSINSTSFPTMWWGYPHLPNSGLVKTIVKNALNGHECIRLNLDRSDGVVDAMAYGGNTPTLSNGVSYTFSFWYRAADDAAIGKTVMWSIYYIATAGNGGLGTTSPMTREWKRHTGTITSPANTGIFLYWWPSSGPCKIDISEIQIEVGSAATPFTPTSRGTTVSTGGGLYDLSENNNHGTLNGGIIKNFSANGNIELNGSTGYVSLTSPSYSSLTGITVEIVFKSTVASNSGTGFLIWDHSAGNPLWLGKNSNNNWFLMFNNASAKAKWASGPASFSANQWVHVTSRMCIADNATLDTGNYAQILVNNVVASTSHLNDSPTTGYPSGELWLGRYGSAINNGEIGSGVPNYSSLSIGYFRMYNRILTYSEMTNNFNLVKQRFGL